MTLGEATDLFVSLAQEGRSPAVIDLLADEGPTTCVTSAGVFAVQIPKWLDDNEDPQDVENRRMERAEENMDKAAEQTQRMLREQDERSKRESIEWMEQRKKEKESKDEPV